MARKPMPGHKLRSYQFGVCVNCGCGWQSSTWYGKGARGNALGEWEWHKEKCAKDLLISSQAAS